MAMETLQFDGVTATTVEVDACSRCRAFWFDTYETLHLTPRSTLNVFAYIGEHSKGATGAWPRSSRCPRCHAALSLAHDRQKATSFQYWKCPAGHGRFEPFIDFLREKDFIKPLTPEEMKVLRDKVQSVHCSSCGAPIDLAKNSVCQHCNAPLMLLDTKKLSEIAEIANLPARPLVVPFIDSERKPLNLVDYALRAVAEWLRGS